MALPPRRFEDDTEELTLGSYQSERSRPADRPAVRSFASEGAERIELPAENERVVPWPGDTEVTHFGVQDVSLPDRGRRAADDVSQDKEDLVARLRKSSLLLELAKYIESLQKESCAPFEDQLERLRLENERLRRQFAMNSMELPLPHAEMRGTSDAADVPRGAADVVQSQDAAESQVTGKTSDQTDGKKNVEFETSSSHGSNSSDDIQPEISLFSDKGRQNLRGVLRKGPTMAFKQVTRALTKREKDEREKKQVFADIDNMKEEVRQAIYRRPYNVAQFYHNEGCFQYVARSHVFDVITLTVISMNAIWIAVDTDFNTSTQLSDAPLIFQVAEYFFATYFLIEWVIRFGAFKVKFNCLRDRWFVFDSILVVLMIIDTCSVQVASALGGSEKQKASDTSVLKLLRMTKLTRMARMARLLRALPELTILVKGIAVAARSVFFTLCLLAVLIYIFSVAFRQLTDGTSIGKTYFASVPRGMKSLLLYGTVPDMADFVDNVGNEHVLLAALLLLFILLGSLTVMNMLVGVLVEVVSVVSAVEKEELKVNYVKTQLFRMLKKCGLPASEDIILSKEDFERLFLKQGAAKVFHDIGVDPVGFLDISEYVFREAGPEGITFRQFIDVVLQMRGQNHATVKDIVDLRRVTLARLERVLEAVEGSSVGGLDLGDDDASQAGGQNRSTQGRSPSPLAASQKARGLNDNVFAQDLVPEAPGSLCGIVPAPPPGQAQELWAS